MGFLRIKGAFLAIGMVLLTMFGVAAGNYMINKKRKCVTLKDPNKKYRLRLIHKIAINHNTRRFRFALPSTNHTLGISPGKCIYLSARINGNLVVRPYTPLCCDDKGFVDLLIKVYFKDQNPDFPEGGKMSQYLDNLSIGETIEFQGPKGLFLYQGKGYFAIQPNKRSPAERKFARHVGMIAGGTGGELMDDLCWIQVQFIGEDCAIGEKEEHFDDSPGLTPMLQLIHAILHDPEDETKCFLLFANKSEEDILLCNALTKLQNENSERFKLWFTVDSASEEWKYSKGYIDSEMIQEHLPPPADDVIILLCGPPAMIKLACKPSLNMLGYDQDMYYVF